MANTEDIATEDRDRHCNRFANPTYDNFAEESEENCVNNNVSHDNKSDRLCDNHIPTDVGNQSAETGDPIVSANSTAQLVVRPQPRERTTIRRKNKKKSEVVYTNVPQVCDTDEDNNQGIGANRLDDMYQVVNYVSAHDDQGCCSTLERPCSLH